MKTSTSAAALAAAIAVPVLLLSGCGSSGDTKGSGATSAPPPASTSAEAAPSEPAAKPTSGGAQAPQATGKAVKLPVTQEALLAMPDLYFEKVSSQYPNAKRNMVVGPKNTLFGRVTTANGVFTYAVADMSIRGNALSTQDGPHVWRRGADTDWEYVGDTGGNLCGQVPQALVKVWGKSCG
ncbi:hypothetical protein GCM10009678_61460 [Actinomadura kijaniata]|uniref:Lipoprotein n=1 Tax=Actinomadura namibiensis TaxID=182080 RepID=A0A7W3LT65_ACTNM|nr:hypothetical protein [Actinomadura namibiensis]MBA8953853.1 hypothetical protein [Actinomadura namibiensis]